MWLQKISILPPQKGLEIPGWRGGGLLKAMYKANSEFLWGGGGGHKANPFCGRVWIFSGTTQSQLRRVNLPDFLPGRRCFSLRSNFYLLNIFSSASQEGPHLARF